VRELQKTHGLLTISRPGRDFTEASDLGRFENNGSFKVRFTVPERRISPVTAQRADFAVLGGGVRNVDKRTDKRFDPPPVAVERPAEFVGPVLA